MRRSVIVRDGRTRSSIGWMSPDVAKRRSGFIRGSLFSNALPQKRLPRLTDRHSRFISGTYPFFGSRLFLFPAIDSRFPCRPAPGGEHPSCAWHLPERQRFGHLNAWRCTASTPRMPSVRCRLLVRRLRISCDPCHRKASGRRPREVRLCTASAFAVNPTGGAMYVVGLDIGYSNVEIAAGPRGALPRLIVRPAGAAAREHPGERIGAEEEARSTEGAAADRPVPVALDGCPGRRRSSPSASRTGSARCTKTIRLPQAITPWPRPWPWPRCG